jgi:hypothetical protein
MKLRFFLSARLSLPYSVPQRSQQGHKCAQDTRSDSWVATDALGRAVPLHGERVSKGLTPASIPAPRPKKYVGMFYFSGSASMASWAVRQHTDFTERPPMLCKNRIHPSGAP